MSFKVELQKYSSLHLLEPYNLCIRYRLPDQSTYNWAVFSKDSKKVWILSMLCVLCIPRGPREKITLLRPKVECSMK